MKTDRHSIVLLLVAVVVAAIPFVYGKYIEFNINSAFDSGSYVYSAKCLVDGKKIDVDINPTARPATLLVNVVGVALFGYSELGPKLIQMLMQMVALGLMFLTLRKIYGDLPAALALILGAYYLSSPPFAKFGNVKEQFMIPCMIVAACGLMRHHGGGSRWWLTVSGAAAINIYFFKPTGASVMIAMAFYLIAQPIARYRSWKQFGGDLLGLLVGAAVGFLPLLLLYSWQGVPLTIVRQIPVIGTLMETWQGGESSGMAGAILGGEYIEGSRAVSTFRRQYDWVVGYYRYLVVPIGLSTLAIVWCAARQVSRLSLRARDRAEEVGQQDKERNTIFGDRVVLLIGIWWLLDMLFVWISPRSYVEYYLPLGASSAMLTGYAVHRCQRQTWGWIWLLALWLTVDSVLVLMVPAEGFPYWSLRSTETIANYSGEFVLKAMPLVAGIAAFVLMKPRRFQASRVTVLNLICVGMFFWWNTGILSHYKQRVEQVHQMHRHGSAYPWEKVSQFIREQSSPGDGLFVWGWYPGVYVQAQRDCPCRNYSYSDMHSDRPGEVERKTEKLVRELRANPPKFIVDSQKVHYPYGEHPVYDLWPQWKDQERGVLYFRHIATDPLKHEGFLTMQEFEEARDLIHLQVEQYSYALLTSRGGRGGPVEPEKARGLARQERARHEAMAPLREFVMKNYRPVPLRMEMHVYQRRVDE